VKDCLDCGEAKSLAEFPRNSKYYGSYCRPCHNMRSRRYYHKNKAQNIERKQQRGAEWRQRKRMQDPLHFRRENMRSLYGLTLEQFDDRLAQQGGCGACGSTTHNGHNWHVDHDHACCPGAKSCGECVRGILCALCNLAIGYAKDDPERLRNMADYLEQFKKMYERGMPF
jgi:hypothetical protein